MTAVEAIRLREPVEIRSLLEEKCRRYVWLRRIIPRIKKALETFPETHPDQWYEYVTTMRRMGGTKSYLMEELAIEPQDALHAWMMKSAMPDDDHVITVDNRFWDNIGPIYPAMELQRKLWERRAPDYERERLRLADEIRALEFELDEAKPAAFAGEDKRMALRRIRFRIEQEQALAKRLEIEILAEDAKLASGPMRTKHGTSTDD